jgi:hypothetical protein
MQGHDVEGVAEIIENRHSIEQALEQMSSSFTPERIAQLVPQTVLVRIYLRQPELATAH